MGLVHYNKQGYQTNTWEWSSWSSRGVIQTLGEKALPKNKPRCHSQHTHAEVQKVIGYLQRVLKTKALPKKITLAKGDRKILQTGQKNLTALLKGRPLSLDDGMAAFDELAGAVYDILSQHHEIPHVEGKNVVAGDGKCPVSEVRELITFLQGVKKGHYIKVYG